MKRMRVDYKLHDSISVERDGDRAIVRLNNGRFMVAHYNRYHKNWTRTNRDVGGAVHRDLYVIATDNIGGGPRYMTLSEARDQRESYV